MMRAGRVRSGSMPETQREASRENDARPHFGSRTFDSRNLDSKTSGSQGKIVRMVRSRSGSLDLQRSRLKGSRLKGFDGMQKSSTFLICAAVVASACDDSGTLSGLKAEIQVEPAAN